MRPTTTMIVSDGSGSPSVVADAVTATARAGRTHHRTRRRESRRGPSSRVYSHEVVAGDRRAVFEPNRPRPCPRARLPGRRTGGKEYQEVQENDGDDDSDGGENSELADSSPPPPGRRYHRTGATKNATIEGEVDRHQGEIRDEQRDVVGFASSTERLECRSSIEGFVSHRD